MKWCDVCLIRFGKRAVGTRKGQNKAREDVEERAKRVEDMKRLVLYLKLMYDSTCIQHVHIKRKRRTKEEKEH